jgi:hypothetical protein
VFDRVDLDPGKRGRYRLTLLYWTGWNPERERLIESSDDLPTNKVWLAYWQTNWIGKGAGKHSEESLPLLLATHHALSRLAQRCDASTPGKLANGLRSMWNAVVDLINVHGTEGWLHPPSGQWRAKIKDGGTVVLRPHERMSALVAITVRGEDMISDDLVDRG